MTNTTLVRAIPKPHLIESIKQSNMGWQGALCELIDNSFGPDAGNAQNVSIEFWKDIVRVTDDGEGVRNMVSMYTLGDSLSVASSIDIGRYGVGAKHACVWIGKRVCVESVRDGKLARCTVDWEKALSSGEWPIVAPVETPAAEGTAGTSVTVEGFWKDRPIVNVPSLVSHIGRIYASALRAGRTITIYDRRKSEHWEHTVEPFRPEGLSDVVTFEVDGCQCEFGILSDKALRHVAGTHYYFGTRWIEKAPDLATQPLPTRIYGTILLGDSYKSSLTQHKDAVMGRVQLEYKILPLLTDLLAKAREYERDLSIDKLNAKLSSLLTRRIRLARPDEDPDTLVSRAPRTDKPVDPNPNPRPPVDSNPRERRPGKYDAKGQPQGAIDIKADNIGPLSPITKVAITNGSVHVTLNLDAPLIRSMFDAQECTRVGFSRAYIAFIGAMIAHEVGARVSKGADYKALSKVLLVDREFHDPDNIAAGVLRWWATVVTVDLFN